MVENFINLVKKLHKFGENFINLVKSVGGSVK